MTAQKYLLFAAVVVLSAVLVRPKYVRMVDLREVVNKTVCPIVVGDDVNPDRVPESIRVMRCSREPDNRCKAQNRPLFACCQQRSGEYVSECVETWHTVLVFYKTVYQAKTHDVSVGCSCMVEKSIPVPQIPESPS